MDPGDCRDTSEKYEGFFMDSSQKDRGLKQEEIHITEGIYSTTIGSDGTKMKIKPTTVSGGRCCVLACWLF